MDLSRARAVLFGIGFELFQSLVVGALAEPAERFDVRAAQDDLFSDVRARRLRDRQQRRREQRGQDGRANPDRSPLVTCDSHSLTGQRYQRPRETPTLASAREKPSAHASWLNASTSVAPAPPSRSRSC